MWRRDIDPFVVLLEHERADEADDRGGVGEDADDVGPSLDQTSTITQWAQQNL